MAGLVIRRPGGDPGNGMDAVRDVAVLDGQIAVGTGLAAQSGDRCDRDGRSPGFIDCTRTVQSIPAGRMAGRRRGDETIDLEAGGMRSSIW